MSVLRTNPNVVAWSTIIGAFAIFLSLSGGIVYGSYWWLTASTIS
ncbi:MAG TPA: hypothetical protein PK954_14155 [Anaerolineales bacterium]|nr:hypothetical protein [Anaerolineales bacterium]